MAISLLAGNILLNGFLRWPSDWDNLMYHLPFIDHWIQAESLYSTHSARWSMPATSELLGAWFAVPFSGDYLIALNNLPAVLILFCSIVVLSKRLGLRCKWQYLAAFLSVASLVTMRQTIDASNDLPVASFFFASLAYYELTRFRGQMAFLLFGITTGVLVGIKYYAIPYAIILPSLLVVRSLRGVDRNAVSASNWIGFVVPFISIGAFWFGRNFVMTGNPFYPIGSSDFTDRVPYPGIHRTTLLYHLNWQTMDLVLAAIAKHFGLAMLFAFGVAPSTVLFALSSRRTRSWNIVAEWTLPYFSCGVVLLITPMLVEDQPGTLNHLRWGYTTARYGLTFWVFSLLLGFFGIAKGLSIVIARYPVLENGTLLLIGGAPTVYLITSISQFRIAQWLGVSIAIFLIIPVVQLSYMGIVCRPPYRYALLKRATVAVALAVSAAIGIAYLERRWHEGLAEHFYRYSRSAVFTRFDKNPHRVLVFDERSYPFFGSRRQYFVTQPMLFYNIDHAMNIVTRDKIDIVVAQMETKQEIARYRNAYEELDAHPSFRRNEDFSSGNYVLYDTGVRE
ncbi:hypothetical protein [Pirellula sp. SH-Sr6A]|uniref:hypothetical protein n=1 Tax=Pirellula sp. SH-Sr6A TaxID=1632865 RepID=UPI0011BABF1B|nr:hypothetical protein [Pirellula sp. SH-Sr6A]